MESILGSQAKQNQVTSVPPQKDLDICSNLINGAEHNKNRKCDKEDNNTGIHKERPNKVNECNNEHSANKKRLQQTSKQTKSHCLPKKIEIRYKKLPWVKSLITKR